MERYYRCFATIVAVYVHLSISVLFRHDRAAELLTEPRLQRHRINQTLPANWTIDLRLHILVKTPLMHIMITVREYDALTARF